MLNTQKIGVGADHFEVVLTERGSDQTLGSRDQLKFNPCCRHVLAIRGLPAVTYGRSFLCLITAWWYSLEASFV